MSETRITDQDRLVSITNSLHELAAHAYQEARQVSDQDLMFSLAGVASALGLIALGLVTDAAHRYGSVSRNNKKKRQEGDAL